VTPRHYVEYTIKKYRSVDNIRSAIAEIRSLMPCSEYSEIDDMLAHIDIWASERMVTLLDSISMSDA